MIMFLTRLFRVCMWRFIIQTTGTPYCSNTRSVFPPHTTSNTTTCMVRVVHVAFVTWDALFIASHAKLGSTLRVIELEPTRILVVRYVRVVNVITALKHRIAHRSIVRKRKNNILLWTKTHLMFRPPYPSIHVSSLKSLLWPKPLWMVREWYVFDRRVTRDMWPLLSIRYSHRHSRVKHVKDVIVICLLVLLNFP